MINHIDFYLFKHLFSIHIFPKHAGCLGHVLYHPASPCISQAKEIIYPIYIGSLTSTWTGTQHSNTKKNPKAILLIDALCKIR